MLRIKENDKFFSRLLSKESSSANPSFRVYHGENSVGVPFVWEATPGIPKHPIMDSCLHVPPLTPPPSSYITQPIKSQNDKNSVKGFQRLIPKMMHKRHNSSASLSSSSTLSSFSSSSSTDKSRSRSRSRVRSLSNSESLFDLFVNGHDGEKEMEVREEDGLRSPRSVMCFGFVGSRKIRCGSVDNNNKV